MFSSILIPYRAIKEYRPSGYLVDNHTHPYYHMILVESGRLMVVCNSRSYTVNPGEAILISPNVVHLIYTVKTAHSIEFKFDIKNEMESLSQIINSKDAHQWTPDGTCSHLFGQAMKEAENKSPFYIDFISTHIYEILLKLLRSSDMPAEEPNHEISFSELKYGTDSEGTISEVLQYMKEHVTENLLIKDIARKFGYSESYFLKLFKSAVGTSPHQYSTHVKINLAKEMIRKSDKNFSTISDELNFSNISAFTNTFKKHCGITPSQFAQRNKECTYINLVGTEDLPADNIRYIEPIKVEDFSQLKFNNNTEK